MRRKSRTIDPAAVADAQATEWMRQEHDKHDPQGRPSTAARPPSRARSIRNNIKEYVFPGTNSRALSRAPSHGSLRTMNTNVSQDSAMDPPNSATGQGWRSWALPRRSGSRSNSRPGTSKGQPEEAEQAKKTNAVNLNRELPPLPSLDSWKDSVQSPPEPPKMTNTGAHIASLMRPQEPVQPERTAAKNKSHRRSGSDTLAMQYSASLAAQSPSPSRHAAPSSRSKTLTPDSLATSHPTLLGSVSTSNLGHVRHSSGSTSTPKKSVDNLNFSRKMSVDTPTTSRSQFSSEVKVSRKEEQKSRLKKVFSGWMTRKEKKDDWMQRIEKEGVKEGVMVPEGAAGAPVVRY
jgi:hypothetical protein